MSVLHVQWNGLRFVVDLDRLSWGFHKILTAGGQLLHSFTSILSLAVDQVLGSNDENDGLAVVQSLGCKQFLQRNLRIAHWDDIQVGIGTDCWQQSEEGNGHSELSKQNGS